jgi:integrase
MISKAFHDLCIDLKIDDLRFHDLRHEATSRLFERGLTIMEVASITGHKTLQMLKRYTHPRADDLAKKLG